MFLYSCLGQRLGSFFQKLHPFHSQSMTIKKQTFHIKMFYLGAKLYFLYYLILLYFSAYIVALCKNKYVF